MPTDVINNTPIEGRHPFSRRLFANSMIFRAHCATRLLDGTAERLLDEPAERLLDEPAERLPSMQTYAVVTLDREPTPCACDGDLPKRPNSLAR